MSIHRFARIDMGNAVRRFLTKLAACADVFRFQGKADLERTLRNVAERPKVDTQIVLFSPLTISVAVGLTR